MTRTPGPRLRSDRPVRSQSQYDGRAHPLGRGTAVIIARQGLHQIEAPAGFGEPVGKRRRIFLRGSGTVQRDDCLVACDVHRYPGLSGLVPCDVGQEFAHDQLRVEEPPVAVSRAGSQKMDELPAHVGSARGSVQLNVPANPSHPGTVSYSPGWNQQAAWLGLVLEHGVSTRSVLSLSSLK